MSDTISEIYTSLRLSNQRAIRISTEPIGQGGEGNVYVVDSPAEWQGHVIKIYHPKERKTERASKLNYMIANPPKVADGYSVIWPIDVVYRGDEFMGYLMKQAPGLYDLTVLSSLKLSIKLESNRKLGFFDLSIFNLKSIIDINLITSFFFTLADIFTH
jgi:hypothetical protein